jgi:hypothetical protein
MLRRRKRANKAGMAGECVIKVAYKGLGREYIYMIKKNRLERRCDDDRNYCQEKPESSFDGDGAFLSTNESP